jgi:hypothetical protein
MASKKAMLMSAMLNRVSLAEAVDFDGTNDYLSRASDFTGNADGKTFTFSTFLYVPSLANFRVLYLTGASSNFYFLIDGAGKINLIGKNAAGSQILSATLGDGFSVDTWYHVLISVDLANVANRSVYINDVSSTAVWSTYTNDSINFTNAVHRVAVDAAGTASIFKGRLAHVFLDYTYRDLSDSANRRLFIDADGFPASGQASLSPILYLPMDDPDTVAVNAGTGGDMTLNGTIARSGRGPNQYNAAASTFDGSADYLSRSSLTGATGTKQGTLHVLLKRGSSAASHRVYGFGGAGLVYADIQQTSTTTEFNFGNSSGAVVGRLSITNPSPVNDKWQSFAVSLDLADIGNRQVLVDGVVPSAFSWSVYTDDTIAWSTGSAYNIGTAAPTPALYYNGEISDFWLDNSYNADLSGFYDTDTGKPLDLGEDGSTPTGSSPLIYLPLRGDDAGSNKGTGGDFTVNSGPFTGARGPSEYWASAAEFNGTNQYLLKAGNLTGITTGKAFSFALAVRADAGAVNDVLCDLGDGNNFLGAGSKALRISLTATPQIRITATNSAGTLILSATATTTSISTAGAWNVVLCSMDLTDAGNRDVYIDGVAQSLTVSTYTDDNISWDTGRNTIAANSAGTQPHDGKLGFLWFNTEYIDFSQEANRLKFFDAFNYPVDIGADGSTPTGNQPLIYLNNEFETGVNYGSGGDFTPTNAPTDGGSVKG